MGEGSLESQVPTIWSDEKAQPGRSSDIDGVVNSAASKNYSSVFPGFKAKKHFLIIVPGVCHTKGRITVVSEN